MENDVLKNKIAPWQEKGRWYHGLWDSDNSNWIATDTDDYLLNSVDVSSFGSNYAIIPKNYTKEQILDVKVYFRNPYSVTTSLNATIGSKRIQTNGKTLTVFAPAATGLTGLCDVWLFIIFDK